MNFPTPRSTKTSSADGASTHHEPSVFSSALMRLVLLVSLGAMVIAGCQRREDVGNLLDSLQDSISKNTPDTQELQNMANDEISKLFAIEYRVVEVSDEVDSKGMEVMLNELGRDRWECQPMQGGIIQGRLLCKRLPLSYLKLLLHLF